MTGLGAIPLRVLIVLLIGFLAALGAFVALSVSGQDTSGLVQFVITAGGLLGLGAHHEARTRQQNQTLQRQDERIAKIDHQTNGVLTQRIEDGARKAVRETFREVGYPLAPDA